MSQAGAEALWRGRLCPSREEQRRMRATLCGKGGEQARGRRAGRPRPPPLSHLGALPPATGSEPLQGRAQGEVRPRASLGLLHVLAEIAGASMPHRKQ